MYTSDPRTQPNPNPSTGSLLATFALIPLTIFAFWALSNPVTGGILIASAITAAIAKKQYTKKNTPEARVDTSAKTIQPAD